MNGEIPQWIIVTNTDMSGQLCPAEIEDSTGIGVVQIVLSIVDIAADHIESDTTICPAVHFPDRFLGHRLHLNGGGSAGFAGEYSHGDDEIKVLRVGQVENGSVVHGPF